MITDGNVGQFYQELLHKISTSKSIAYRHFDEENYYNELYLNILKINSVLHNYHNEKIILYTDKSFSAYSAIYCVFLSQNIWVPLSTDMPEMRTLDILRAVEPKMFLYNIPLPSFIVDFLQENGIVLVDINTILTNDQKRDFDNFDFQKDNIAYIMFTSGSTGLPKGVPMTHQNYINFINNCLNILPFGENEVFSDYHDFAFDISIFYLFCCPLKEGAFAPVINETDKMIPLHFIQKNKVTVWSSVPSAISRIQSLKPNDAIQTDINIMFLCGEPLSLKVLEFCLKNMGICHIYNFYGLTETGVENFYHECSSDDFLKYVDFGFVPIGRPLPGNEIDVSTERELLISGPQITPGYLGGIGTERFEIIEGVRWFHTGDIVNKYEDVYICKGRMDSQVKVRGYRIELMDIEVQMRKFEGVDAAVCFTVEKRNNNILVGVVKPKPGFELNTNTLIDFLKKNLPHYMIPAMIYIKSHIPLNQNGKIDRRKIRETYLN